MLEAQTARLGPNHPDTLHTKGDLAVVMKKQGDLPEARALYEAVLEAQTARLGPNHPDTLLTKGNLTEAMAIATEQNGELAEAAGLYSAAADLWGPIAGETHELVVECRAKARELGV